MAKRQSYKDKLRETEFKNKIFESLKAARGQGLVQGSRAILRVIGDKITEKNDMSPEEKLADIMRFINVSLDLTDKTANEADRQAEEARKPIDKLGQDEDDEEEVVIEMHNVAPQKPAQDDLEDDDE